jgi:peptide/nickel transport system substrate-binding protein
MQARRRKATIVVAAIAALTVGAAGCAKSSRSTSSSKSGGTFIFAGAGDPRNFDPIFNDDGESLRVIRQLYDTLIQNKPGTADLQPALAESWEHDAEGKVWTFHLRKNVKFHDGTALDAAAVCYNFDRWFNVPGEAAQSIMAYYADVFEGFAKNTSKDFGDPVYNKCEAKDASTPVITLNKYKGAFPGAFTLAAFAISSPTALKKYDADKVTQQGDSFEFSEYANLHPTGTGPFTFGGWDKSTNQITLNRNPDYWGEKAKVDKVIIKIIKDETTRKQELRAGTVDAIDFPAPADRKALADEGFNVMARPAFNVLYLGMNQKSNPKLADLRVRQAIAYAVNREQLAKTKGPTQTVVAKEFMPPAVSGYADDVVEYKYDPEKAKALLKEAGAEGITLNFYYPPDVSRPYMPNPTEIFQAISADLTAVGFKVVGTARPWNGGYRTDIQQLGKPDLHIIGWTGDYNDAGNFLATFFGRAKKDFGDDAMTDMFAVIAAANAEVDDAKKKQLWQQANRDVMAKYLPALPIWHSPPAIVTSKKVTGLIASPLTDERFNTVSKS